MTTWQLAMVFVGLVLSVSLEGNPIGKEDGIVDVPSNHSVDETVQRLKNILCSAALRPARL